MALTKEEVQSIALLARLRLSDEEQNRLAEQLDKILQYVHALDRLDTSEVEPMAHALDMANTLREDCVTHRPSAEALLANAPATEQTFFRVPKIIE